MVWVLEGLDGFNVEDHALRGFRAWGYRACMRYISESIPRNHICYVVVGSKASYL